MSKPAVKEISPAEADSIIDTRQPIGLFYYSLNGLYTAIDNSSGMAWVEDGFRTLCFCIAWLQYPEILDSSCEMG